MATTTRTDELASEQAYFDAALDCRERLRHSLAAAPEAAAHPRNAPFVKDAAQRAAQGLGRPEEAVAFGRIDDEDGERLYIGVNAIWNDDRDLLVLNWQVETAGRYYTASVADPHGVARIRQYSCEKNTIVSFDDRVFADLVERIADLDRPSIAFEDSLLEELDRTRTGEMQEIVKTIQAAQYDLIREPLDQLLVVQGGPGTGKTAVALHRVSWLLYNHRDKLAASDVLVVGPTRAFVRYIRTVLPTLGDEDVQQREIGALAPSVTSGREEVDEVALLKGDARMARLVERGLTDRIGLPEDQLTIPVGQSVIPIDHGPVQEQIDRLVERPYAIGRGLLRDWLRDHVARLTRGTAARADSIDAVVERVWPQLTAPAFLQDLLGSESRLLRAGGEEFSAAEVSLLYRRATPRITDEVWSQSDLPLLDCAQFAMTGEVDRKYAHIVVDEAQDLSPMQLLSIRRRSVDGSMTILGDIAQSTGAWARDDWEDVVAHLRQDLPAAQRELTFGYRVPRQIFELARQLLPKAAPGVTPPTVVRDGPEAPRLEEVTDPDDVPAAVVRHVREYLGHGLMVALICPDAARAAVVAELSKLNVLWRDVRADGIASGVNLLAPTESKGLEFDAVVIVRPDLVVDSDLHGERLLYIAMTRSTRFMSVIHTNGPIPGDSRGLQTSTATPRASGTSVPVPTQPTPKSDMDVRASQGPPRPNRVVAALAASIADDVRGTLNPDLWRSLLEEIRERLQTDE